MASLQLGIRTKINGGFGVLVALCLGLAGFASFELAQIGDQVGRMATLSDVNSRAAEIGDSFEAIRSSLLRFRVAGDDESLKQAADAETKAATLLAEVTEVDLSPERRRLYDQLGVALGDLRAHRGTLVALGKEMHDQREKLNAVGEELTESVAKLVEAALATGDQMATSAANRIERRFQLVRVGIWRFLATKDASALDLIKRNAPRASAGLVAMGAAEPPDNIRAMIAPARTALTGYTQTFDGLSGALLKTEELFNKEIVPRLTETQGLVENAQHLLSGEFTGTRQATQTSIAETTTLQKVVGALVLVLGVIVGVLISRSITRPVAGMTGAMGRIAEGDNAVEIPFRENKDEMGTMARALEVLKQNSLERARMRQEQTEREKAQADERRHSMIALADAFEKNVGGIVAVVGTAASQLQGSANAMTGTAEAVTRQAAPVSAASTQASANVQTVASATEPRTAPIGEIGPHVERSSQIAGRAGED